ncbi:MAG: protein-methionine-sulfoxide reductase heme-binding subunit MsrQ [Dehalococcoidia bacterium]|nr:protein-methionine-sulfoxide reductase heme-binding subunit MsrQ [Dehalococcoidia bacterium]
MQKTIAITLRILLHAGALSPLLLLIWDFTQGGLTANPIREIQLRTGRYTLLLLTLTLACTPVYNFTGFRQALALRRPMGLYAFAYASLHLLNLVGLDYGFDFALLWEDIAEKRYIIAGFAAFLILLALAVTSTKGWVRRLGRNWQRLHWLIYVAGILAVLHYLWQIKIAISAPFIYGIIVLVLLLLRVPAVSRVTMKYFKRKEGR